MAVKKKVSKKFHQFDIDEVINRGGKTVEDSRSTKLDLCSDHEIRFTLRIPNNLIVKIDSERKKRVGNVSRNQWILEAIGDQLDVK